MKTIFIDCSFLADHVDLNTGIQRVVRRVVETLPEAAKDTRIVPVRINDGRFNALSIADLYPGVTQHAGLTPPPVPFRSKALHYAKRVYHTSRELICALAGDPPKLRNFMFAPPGAHGLNHFVLLYLVNPLRRLFSTTEQKPDNQASGISVEAGDVLLLLDSTWYYNIWPTVTRFRQRGGRIILVSYDLIPITHSQFCDDSLVEFFKNWFKETLSHVDGYVCISRTVQNDLETFMRSHFDTLADSKKFSHFLLGADFKSTSQTREELVNTNLRDALAARPNYLIVSTVEPRKNHAYLLDAFDQLWRDDLDVGLTIIGRIGWKVEGLLQRIKNHPEYGRRLNLFSGLGDDELAYSYTHSRCLVFPSIVEGFGLPIVESLAHGLPVLASDTPIHREIGGDRIGYFQLNQPEDLAETIRTIEREGLPDNLKIPADYRWLSWSESTVQLYEAIQACLPDPSPKPRQLLVDISELMQRDAKSGIQRVVRAILREWLENPPQGLQVEPIYAVQGTQGYRYARRFTSRFLNIPDHWSQDDPVKARAGDIFFGLDLQPHTQITQRPYYQALHQDGVKVYFLVHDLLPIQMPQHFALGAAHEFDQWLAMVTENDGAVCVSATTAHALENWLQPRTAPRSRPFQIKWSHNGADIDGSRPSLGLPPEASDVLTKLAAHPVFLMVSTIEPRKRHDLVLQAFELLWQEGHEVNLVIVGKQGWMVEALIERMRSHPQSGKHLFWLDGISDEYLEKIYSAASCLIAASEAEGFGLPLIEAARHKLPIMARDIPVFHEIAGEHAYYFSGVSAMDMADAIKTWLELAQNGKAPLSSDMPWLTWKESAQSLMETLLDMDTTY